VGQDPPRQSFGDSRLQKRTTFQWTLWQDFDLDVAEVDFCPFRLPADRAFTKFALAFADGDTIDFGTEMAVFAGNLSGVPFADRFNRFFLSGRIFLEFAFSAADGEDVAVIAIHALHLDAARPDTVWQLNVHKTAAVTGEFLILAGLKIGWPLVTPVKPQHIIAIALLRIEVAIRFARHDDHAVFDADHLV
jgi:hypothetical protein